MTITSPNNDQLKEIRKLAGRKWRDKLRQFVAEGEDLLAAADAAGWEPLGRVGGGGPGGAGGGGGQAAPAGSGLPARLRHARARRLRPALGAGACRAAVPGAVGRQRS